MLWLALALCAFFTVPVDDASAETRKLKLYFLHTGERAEITYKRNGKYLPGGLKKINWFLRDWRRKEATKMDPKLLDLIYEVYKETGSRKHIHIISAYRSVKTNNLLRKRGRGVAKKSQHSLGRAMDFFIPGVRLSKLREIGLRKGLGGVGYYPKSGSPFVHMDTGRVRHWPRMSRRELARIFPNGKTLHVPSDGKPLPGYNAAKRRYERATSGKIVVAKAEEIEKKPGLFANLLGRDNENDSVEAATAPRAVATTTTAPATANVAPSPQTGTTTLTSFIPPRIAIPTVAPRAVPAPQPETQLALAEPDPAETYRALTQEQGVTGIPIPAQPTRPGATDEAVALVAQAEPLTRQEPAIQVAALSPTEIQDLRRQVDIAINTPATQNTTPVIRERSAIRNPFGTDNNAPAASQNWQQRLAPRTNQVVARGNGVRAVRPGAGLTGENQRLAANSGEALFGYADSTVGTSDTAITALRPSKAAQDALQKQFSLARIEQAVEAQAPEIDRTEATASSTLNNQLNRIVEPATAENTPRIEIPQNGQTQGAVELASLPIPVQSPRHAEPATQIAQLVSRETRTSELTLEQFQSANLNERLVGKWALATNARISDIAEIRPPAYGRNALRERPNMVLSSGFSRQKIDQFARGFSGSSVEFLNFKRFD